MSEMSPLVGEIFLRLGEKLLADRKPITTRACLEELRSRKEGGAYKVLREAGLHKADLPKDEDEGDAGVYSTCLDRALTSSELLAHGSPVYGSQHVLWGLLREEKGVAGRWLRQHGLKAEEVDWSRFPDPRVEPAEPPRLAGKRAILTLSLLLIFGLASESVLGPALGIFGLIYLPQAILLWIEPTACKRREDCCSRCGARPELPALRDLATGLCRRCERHLLRVPVRNYLLLFLVMAVAAAVCTQVYLPLSWMFVNLGLAILSGIAATVIHELGHLVAGVLTGHHIMSFHIGRSAVKRCLKFGSIWWYWQSPPLGGMVMGMAPPQASFKRIRTVIYSLGGPAANLLAAGLLWPHLQTWSLSLAWSRGIDIPLTFWGVNLAMGLRNLYPGVSKSGDGLELPSDGRTALEALRTSPQHSPKLMEQLNLLNAEVYRSYGNPEAELLILQSLVSEPNREQKLHFMYLYWQLERWQDSLVLARELADPDPETTVEQRGSELNCLAWAHFRVGDLEAADRYSAASMELLPNLTHGCGTRGEVLAARGRFLEGKVMLERAVALSYDAVATAHNCKALSRIAALQGDEAEFQRLSLLVEELDPNTGAYPSPAAAIEEARKNGHCLEQRF